MPTIATAMCHTVDPLNSLELGGEGPLLRVVLSTQSGESESGTVASVRSPATQTAINRFCRIISRICQARLNRYENL